MTEPPDGGFRRRIGLFDATMLVAGSMIGSGIFIVSAGILQEVGSSGWLLVVWAIAGLMTVLGALAYAELAAMMPHAGGQYVYLREAYGPLPGFLFGWTSALVIQTGTIAAVAVGFAKFLGVFLPAFGTEGYLKADGELVATGSLVYESPELNWRVAVPLPWREKPVVLFERERFTVTRGQFIAAGLIVLLSLWNCLGVREGKWLQNIFTVAKYGSLALLIGVGLTVAVDPAAVKANLTDPWGGLPGKGLSLAAWMVVGGALVGALFSSDAWNNVTFIAGEVKNPARTLPMALFLGTASVVLLYLLCNVAYLAALPTELIAGAEGGRVGTALMAKAMPGWGVSLMAAAILVSTFGCVNGLVLSGARLTWAMARDGLFFQGVGTLNARGVPQTGLLTQAIWASLLVFSGTYGELLDYVIFAALLFYAMTVGGLFVLRWRRPAAERPVRAIGYPVLPGLYVLLCLVVATDLLVVKPVYTLPGLVLVLAGVPVYLLWKVFGRPAGPSPGERGA
jgi:APA family basic amino acid/polyamine antiporter